VQEKIRMEGGLSTDSFSIQLKRLIINGWILLVPASFNHDCFSHL